MTTTELLKAFTATNDTRKYLHAPFLSRDGKHLVASDGMRLVVCAKDGYLGEISEGPSGKSGDHVHSVIDKVINFKGDGWSAELPAQPESTKCGNCDGEGVLRFDKCDSCDGEGEFEHWGHRYDCKECGSYGIVCRKDGKNSEECSVCGGTGKVYSNIKVHGVEIAERLFSPLRSIDGVELLVTGQLPKFGGMVLLFRFEGGRGCIMPLRK